MGSLFEIGKTGELTAGSMKEIITQGHEILLAQVGDNYYATENRCPHMAGKLSQGKIEGTIVTCPRHSSQFDLKDGQVVRWLKGSGLVSALGKAFKSPKPLKVYKVSIQGDKIMVEL